ncbi:tyrosine-type recombinase/integrase [Pseudooceanicola sp. LIPI14-2-Ac024]|uniref:tyrosine-type recombinase/integrase n=1 Tax=Pseudooceanicola sp. LIPI14-2-Ac024 TaxID=3344875 RepID=UPI0035D0A358
MATFTKLKSGKFRAMVRKKGVYKTATFDDEKQAKRWATDVEHNITRTVTGLQIVPQHVTLGELLRKYMEEVEVRTPSTRYVYTKVAEDRLGQVRLRDLSAQHVDEWVARKLRKAKPVSVRMYLNLLTTPLKWAVAVKHFAIDDQVFKLAIQRMKHNKLRLAGGSRSRVLSPSEEARLRQYWTTCEEAELRGLPMDQLLTFAITTCCRIGETCKVTADDYRPAEDGKHPKLMVRDRKSIGPDPYDTLIPLYGEAETVVLERIAMGFTDVLFPYPPYLVSRVFKTTCAKVSIHDITWHDLRHTGCTRYANMGLSLMELKLISGHKSTKSLEIYVNTNADDVYEKLRQLDPERLRHLMRLAAE